MLIAALHLSNEVSELDINAYGTPTNPDPHGFARMSAQLATGYCDFMRFERISA